MGQFCFTLLECSDYRQDSPYLFSSSLVIWGTHKVKSFGHFLALQITLLSLFSVKLSFLLNCFHFNFQSLANWTCIYICEPGKQFNYVICCICVTDFQCSKQTWLKEMMWFVWAWCLSSDTYWVEFQACQGYGVRSILKVSQEVKFEGIW